uniref:Uncharacterized protein n=1 Tax=Tetradesmus obliquus TaxID=3088 RepID=A0A383W909_TETOB|eukprot:jgi/Sobl393_1/15796/SZX73599.1
MSPGDATLPSQLQALVFRQCRDLAPVLALKQLQRLELWPINVEQRQLLELAKLSALQTLHLNYAEDTISTEKLAAVAAPTWALLPQLRALDVKLSQLDASSKQHVAAIVARAAAATQLTSLQLSFVSKSACCPLPYEHAMRMCARLAGLTGLKDLALHAACMVPGDALALTALTGLTSLVLSNIDSGVRRAEATALARSLKHLQHLDFSGCRIDLRRTDAAFLAAVCKLRQLTYLNLEGIDGLTQQGLMRLTCLTRLQELDVDTDEDVSCEVLDKFWAAVQRQQQA